LNNKTKITYSLIYNPSTALYNFTVRCDLILLVNNALYLCDSAITTQRLIQQGEN